MALPLLLAPIVYGSVYSSISEFEACAVKSDPNFDLAMSNGECVTTTHDSGGTISTCCWKVGDKWACQTCAINKEKTAGDCNPVEISYERPPPPSPTLETNDELADPNTGQTPQPPTETSPGGDISGPPADQAADPNTGQTPQPPTGTFPGGDISGPPADQAADPNTGQTPQPPTGTFPGGDISAPPADQAADPGTGQSPNDDIGNEDDGIGKPDVGVTGPEVGEVKPNLPSGGDGGKGSPDGIVG
jgi:hypothetical protein